jgi:hypothetical protein
MISRLASPIVTGFASELSGQYKSLLAEATVVGSAGLPVTCSRTGARKPIFSPTGEVASDTPDVNYVDGLSEYSSMAGATNLVDTDLTNWVKSSSNVDVTDQGGGVFRLSFNGLGVGTAVSYTLPTASLDRYASFGVRLVSGTPNGSSTDYISFRSLGSPVGTRYALVDTTAEFTNENAFVTSASSTNQLSIRADNDSAFVIEIRLMRVANLSAPAAAFPDGSAAGATYDTDLLSCAPSWGSQGTIMAYATAYDWSISPSDFARVFEVNSGGLRIEQFQDTSSWFPFDPGGVSFPVVINPYVGNAAAVWSIDWDGVTSGSRINTETRNTQAQTSTPSGTLYIGNNSFGTSPFHGSLVTLIFPRVLTDAEYEIVRAGLQLRLANRELY